jgi:hypothetical protein
MAKISAGSAVKHGQAVIAGTRVPISVILGCIAAGHIRPAATGIVILRLADQSAATVIEATGDLASLAKLESLAGSVTVLQRGLLRLRHP